MLDSWAALALENLFFRSSSRFSAAREKAVAFAFLRKAHPF